MPKHTTPTTRARIVDRLKLGAHPNDVARAFKRHRTTVVRLFEKYKNSSSFYHTKPRPGRPRKFTARDGHFAVWKIRSGEATDATDLQRKFFPNVTPQTVRLRLTELGLPGYRRRRKFVLLRGDKISRLRWVCQHEDWEAQDWERVVFSDEFRINRWGSDGMRWCRRGPGEGLRDSNVRQEMKHGGGHLMVWGCITGRGFGRLHKIQGNMDSKQYVSILEESLLGTLRDHSLSPTDVIFQHDNDPKHTSRHTRQWLTSQKLCVLPWPARSPDMNCIENVWDVLKMRVGAIRPRPKNLDELWEVVQREWEKLGEEYRRTLYDSMPRRIDALKQANGSYTKY